MDFIGQDDDWGVQTAPAAFCSGNGTSTPSIEDLIVSMRSHLLNSDGEEGEGEPTATFDPPPVCSSPIDSEVFSDTLENGLPGIDVLPTGQAVDFIGNTGSEAEQRRDAARPVCRQGSQHPSDGQFTSSDLPLSGGYQHGDNIEEIEVDLSNKDHPRLQSNFYQRLRHKYPKAFKRRSSISSDTTSVCSDATGTSQPASTMTPMPRGHTQPTAQEGHCPRQGLPPRPPGHAPQRAPNGPDLESRRNVKMITHHLMEDLTITGTARHKQTHRQRVENNLPHSDDGHLQGILKKDLGGPDVSLTSDSSLLDRSDSTLSLKERLHKNKMTLRALLSEENNPLRKRRVREKTDLNQSFSSDIMLGGELSLSISTTQTDDGASYSNTTSSDNLLQIKRDNHSANGQATAVRQGQRQMRSLADHPQRKHVGTKRYISPDSSHDSAVDMDTASLQSSPGSSDTQTTVITNRNAPKSNNNKHTARGQYGVSPGGGARIQSRELKVNDVLDGHQVSPRERLHMSTSHSDYQLAAPGMSHSRGDSDVDSGIANGSYPPGPRERRDSSSSMENDQELESIMSLSRVQNGHRYAAISSQDFKNAHKSRSGAAAGAKYGPLKADHSIQPSSPRQDPSRDELDQVGMTLGQSRKASSVQDLSQRKSPPMNRVHFEDEAPTRQSHPTRSLSHSDLSLNPKSPNDDVQSDAIPSGCRRAHKLRGARRAAGSPSPASSQMDVSCAPVCSQTDSETKSEGLPPSGRNEDLKLRMHRLRNRSKTPTEMIHAAASDSCLPENSNLPVHRASPVIISQNGLARLTRADDNQSFVSDTPSSDMDLHNEVAYFNGFNDAWVNALATKKSKKPWKRNKGKYIPSESDDHRQTELKGTFGPGLPRPSSGLEGRYADSRPSKGRLKSGPPGVTSRPASCTAELSSPAPQPTQRPSRRRAEDPYEEVAHGTDSGVRAENPYEEVQFHHGADSDVDIYAVSQKPSKGKTSKASHSKNPCVVSDADESISVEVAPPVPERGYDSDLEKYKELSGSRTSLAGRVDSFRRAAKNKWSALRRAVSLERVDRTDGGEEASGGGSGPFGRLIKSPSLQSLTKKLSFKRKDSEGEKGRTVLNAGLPPTPRGPARVSRPSSAPLRRSKKHSASLTSLNSVDAPQNFRPIGKLKQLNPDGTQILELVRPPHGPFGFYIARGNVKYGGGVFVSRLSDGLPEHFFAGLLSVGDEILEINCQPINNLTLDEVYAMMAERHHLLLKTLPYIARQDR